MQWKTICTQGNSSKETQSLLQCYMAKVLPIITYAAPAWYGFTSQYCRDKRESTQKMATKILIPETESYQKWCEHLDLMPITKQLEELCTSYFTKILQNAEHILYNKSETNTNCRSARNTKENIKLVRCRTQKQKKAVLTN